MAWGFCDEEFDSLLVEHVLHLLSYLFSPATPSYRPDGAGLNFA